METPRIRALRPHTLEWGDYRPAKLTAIAGASSTIRVRLATGFYRDRTVATSTLPTGVAVGAPLVVRVSGDNPGTFTVLSVAGSHWGGDAPRNEAADITNDGRWPVIPREITGASEVTWTA
jgi:hypothetical protein